MDRLLGSFKRLFLFGVVFSAGFILMALISIIIWPDGSLPTWYALLAAIIPAIAANIIVRRKQVDKVVTQSHNVKTLQTPDPPIIPQPSGRLTYVEKEHIMVQRISTKDMLQFTEFPYDLDFPVHKFFAKNGHPFAYIDLSYANQRVAKAHVSYLNSQIDKYRLQIPLLTRAFFADMRKLVFENRSGLGYTRLICTPYTFEGRTAKYPLSLIFISDDSGRKSYNGSIYYGANGKILKADIHIWCKPVYGINSGWSFYFNTIDGVFLLYEAKTTLKPDEKGLPTAVYKDSSIIEWEKERDRDLNFYEWLQISLPSICPKSFSGFRRMKTMNTKNYQKIVSEAAKQGKAF